MSKKELRGIAIGILIATGLLAYFFYFTDSAKKDVTEDDIKAYLASNDKVAISSKEYESLLDTKREALTNPAPTNETEVKEEPKEKTKEKTKEEPKPEEEPKEEPKPEEEPKEEVYSAVVTVSKGTTIYEVAERLQGEKIIADKKELINYLEDNDLAKYLQLGTYELNSNMTIEEIAKIIATPKS